MAAAPQLVPTPAPADVERIPPNRARIGTLSDEQIIEQIRRQRTESSDRLRTIMDVGLQCWEQYRNKQDFTDKQDWESRVTIAKAHAAVKHFVANIMRLMTQSPQWVTVNDITRQSPSFAPFVEAGVLKAAEIAEFKAPLRDAIEMSGATMFGAMKITWQHQPFQSTTINASNTELTQRTYLAGSLAIKSIDPWKVHFGPNTSGGRANDYVIEDSEADLTELLEAGTFENLDKFLDKGGAGSSDSSNSIDQPEKKKDLDQTSDRVRKRLSLYEFWGDLIDPQTQRIVARDMHIIVANDQQIIKFESNPLWDKKAPYIFFSPLIVAGRFPGAGILEMSLAVKRAIDRIAQMWEDHLHFSVLPMWEADLSTLENPEDIGTGVYPGKIFRKKMGSAGIQTFRPLDVRPMTADSFNTVIAFDKEYQRGTFITEQTQGLIDAKGETTATEVQQTAIASTLILSDIASHLELQLLAPMGEVIWDRLFQFLDHTSVPNWSMLIGQQGAVLDMLSPADRMEIVQGLYTFKSHGLSKAIARQQERTALIEFVRTISQLGPAQVIINIPAVISRLYESFHLENPQELLAPNWQAMFQQFQLATLAAANPMAQLEARNAAAQEKNASHLEQIELEKTLEGRNAILTEAAAAAFNPPPEKKE